MTLNKVTTSFRGYFKICIFPFSKPLKTGEIMAVPLFRILRKLRLIVVTFYYKVLSGNFLWIILFTVLNSNHVSLRGGFCFLETAKCDSESRVMGKD